MVMSQNFIEYGLKVEFTKSERAKQRVDHKLRRQEGRGWGQGGGGEDREIGREGEWEGEGTRGSGSRQR